MKNILHIINSLDTGGAEVLLKDSLNEFIEKGYSYKHFVLPLFKSGEVEQLFSKEVTILSNITSQKNIFNKLLRVKQLVKQYNITTVHAHLYESCIFSRFLKNKGVKIINSYHTGFHNSASIEFSKKRLLLDKLLKQQCDLFIFVSNAVKEQITHELGVTDKKCVTLPNFAHRRFYPVYKFNSSLPLRLVSVGNLRVQKNFQLLLDALLEIKGSPVEVDIYGEGSLREELMAFITLHNLPCRLMGRSFITSELLSKYDAFIMTSLHEGMPVSLIEAISAGLPSILNDIPELRETANSGAIYFARDSIKDLSKTLLDLVTAKQRLDEVAKNVDGVARIYKIDNFLDVLETCY